MWQAISEILTKGNILSLTVCLIVIVLLAIILVKSGVLKIDTNHFQLGVREDERKVIQQQKEFAYAFVMSLEYSVPKFDGYNEYITKYILERMYDEVVDWIVFNHITTSGDYIKVKGSKLCYLVDCLAKEDIYKSEEMHEYIKAHVEILIKELVHIREVYK